MISGWGCLVSWVGVDEGGLVAAGFCCLGAEVEVLAFVRATAPCAADPAWWLKTRRRELQLWRPGRRHDAGADATAVVGATGVADARAGGYLTGSVGGSFGAYMAFLKLSDQR